MLREVAMTSSTSSSKKPILLYIKALKNFLIALIIVAVAELSVVHLVGMKNLMPTIHKDNLLDLNFLKGDSISLYITGYKNYLFFDDEADLLLVGDSSGLYDVQPLIVNDIIIANHKMINVACCADVGWQGYASNIKHHLDSNKKIKYVVLSVSPYSLPVAVSTKFGNGFAPKLSQLYSSSWIYFYQFPSLYFRKNIVEKTYYGQERDYIAEVMDLYVNKESQGKYNHYTDLLFDNLGWAPFKKNEDWFAKMNRGECGPQMIEYFYDKKTNQSYLGDYLSKIKDLTNQYKAKLIVIFAPVACKDSEQIKPIIDEINQFKKLHPDVYFPFDFINNRDENDFADNYHLLPEASETYSEELAEKLASFLESEKIKEPLNN